MPESTKTCTLCNEVLPITDYWRAKRKPQGRESWCKPCSKTFKRKPKEDLPEGKKRCNECKKILSFDVFTKNYTKQDGTISYGSKCNDCKAKNRRESNPNYEELPPNTKRCNKCNEILSLDNFYSTKSHFIKKDGSKSIVYEPHCIPCKNYIIRQKFANDIEFRTRELNRKKIYGRYKLDNDPIYRMKKNIARNVRFAFKRFSTTGKIMSSRKYKIDYNSIIDRLGAPPGDNYDIDHIIPISLFNHDDLDQIRLCWSAKNLQWMERKTNISKKDYISDNMEDYPEELHEHWKVAYRNYLEKKGESDVKE